MKNIKEVLSELKSFSELVVTVGYAAILQNDPELAMEAQLIKNKIRVLSYEMRLVTIYAVRSSRNSTNEIMQLASLLQVGVASKEISDGIDDLVEIVLRGGGAHPLLRDIYGDSETLVKIKINKNSNTVGKRLSQIKNLLKDNSFFEVLFIRNGEDYTIGEEIDYRKIQIDDVIVIKTSEEKTEEVKKIFS
jgi:uncharacterized protein with PhoU and TrkA domain